MRFYAGPRLLVIDELGYLPLPADGAAALFQVINQRYLNAPSTILTTNVGIADWATAFGDATVAAAMLDRLLHRAAVVGIDGPSYRLRAHQARAAPCAGSRRPCLRDPHLPRLLDRVHRHQAAAPTAPENAAAPPGNAAADAPAQARTASQPHRSPRPASPQPAATRDCPHCGEPVTIVALLTTPRPHAKPASQPPAHPATPPNRYDHTARLGKLI